MQHARKATLVQHDVVEREPSLAPGTGAVEGACLELHAPLGEIVAGSEATQRELGFAAATTREEPEASEVDAENGYGAAGEQACAAKERSVAAQRDQGVDLRLGLEPGPSRERRR